jgi:micrococcal nuclease
VSHRRPSPDATDDEAADLLGLWVILVSLGFMAVVLAAGILFGHPAHAEGGQLAQARQRPAQVADTPWRLGPYRRVSVIDGDTIDTPTNSGLARVIRVRLLGLDTPEASSACPEEKAMAQEAADFLRRQTAEPVAVVTGLDFDRYGRVLGKLFDREGRDIGQRLIEGGYAVAYTGGARQNWCEIARRRAIIP